MKISFKDWVETNYDFFFLEAPVDLSRFPVDKIQFKKYDNDDEDGFIPSEFEEEDFDEDYARNRCEDSYPMDDYDLNDYSYGEIFDSIEDDPNFKTQSAEEWEEENPKPERSAYDSEIEYDAAIEAWQEERDDVESDYESAVEDWHEENDRTREAAEESASEARQRDIEDCVENSRESWESEQENRRAEHEKEIENEKEEFRSSLPPYGSYEYEFKLNQRKYKVEIDRNTDYFKGERLIGVFDVFFEGPSTYNLTRDSSPQHAREVYSNLIASIIKFIEEEEKTGHPVNGFQFNASEPDMEIIYDLFYKNYLSKAGFVRTQIISHDFYLKKDYVREMLKRLRDFEKKDFFKGIVSSNRDKKQLIQGVRDSKSLGRENALFFQQNKNKFLYFKNPGDGTLRLGFLYSLELGSATEKNTTSINKIKVFYVNNNLLVPTLCMKSDFVQKPLNSIDFINFYKIALHNSNFYEIYQSQDFKKYYNIFSQNKTTNFNIQAARREHPLVSTV
ncbi:MAG: hypothetical protein EKK64_03560 [Neisseriaceae bacterium]|nr:MAG: hypothetical protein EKK64_03560 [Neisseriaceae bacterium]